MNCPECNAQEITTISYPSEGNRQEFFCRACRHKWRADETLAPVVAHASGKEMPAASQRLSKKSLRNHRRKVRKAQREKMRDAFQKAMDQARLNAELAKGTGKPNLGRPLGGEDLWDLVKRVHAD